MPESNTAPIFLIKKKKKNKRQASHGGWKVAMADLMVSMMCLFLVLWLIGMMSDDERMEIKQYFSQGFFDTNSHMGHTSSKNALIDMPLPATATALESEQEYTDRKTLIEGDYLNEDSFLVYKQEIEERMELLDMTGLSAIEVIPQGLKITFNDNKDEPMFYRGGVDMSPFYEDVLLGLAPVLSTINNRMILVGHTDASRYLGVGKSNWNLSTQRANAARLTLEYGGVDKKRFFQVTGMSDTQLAYIEEPYSHKNRRIELYILSYSAERSLNAIYGSQASKIADNTIDKKNQEKMDKGAITAIDNATMNKPTSVLDSMIKVRQ